MTAVFLAEFQDFLVFTNKLSALLWRKVLSLFGIRFWFLKLLERIALFGCFSDFLLFLWLFVPGKHSVFFFFNWFFYLCFCLLPFSVVVWWILEHISGSNYRIIFLLFSFCFMVICPICLSKMIPNSSTNSLRCYISFSGLSLSAWRFGFFSPPHYRYSRCHLLFYQRCHLSFFSIFLTACGILQIISLVPLSLLTSWKLGSSLVGLHFAFFPMHVLIRKIIY